MMKKRLLTVVLCSLACIFVFASLAAAQGGELVAAEYGAGNHRVDVTPQVRSFMHDGVLEFDVLDSTFGVDPARNHVKELSSAFAIGMATPKSFAILKIPTSVSSSIPIAATNITTASFTSCAPSMEVRDILSTLRNYCAA